MTDAALMAVESAKVMNTMIQMGPPIFIIGLMMGILITKAFK